jgi:malate dehydrogenase (oxaloacetate-decarboxylating)
LSINGAGSAGIAITKFLLELGAKHITVCDRFGIIYDKHPDLNSAQQEIAKLTNKKHLKGSLTDALKGADVFIGVSAGNIVTKEMISSMNSDAIVFPLANPIPEISRDLALLAGARVVGTGASNLPNQINNALVFPGLFRGALDSGAKQITTKMQIAACHALSKIVSKKDLKETYIIPSIFDKRVLKHISKAVMNASTL